MHHFVVKPGRYGVELHKYSGKFVLCSAAHYINAVAAHRYVRLTVDECDGNGQIAHGYVHLYGFSRNVYLSFAYGGYAQYVCANTDLVSVAAYERRNRRQRRGKLSCGHVIFVGQRYAAARGYIEQVRRSRYLFRCKSYVRACERVGYYSFYFRAANVQFDSQSVLTDIEYFYAVQYRLDRLDSVIVFRGRQYARQRVLDVLGNCVAESV